MKKPSNPTASSATGSIETFVLAGARASGDALAKAHNVPSKAHIQVAGRSMLGRVLGTLSDSDYAGPVTVIGLTDDHSLRAAEAWPDAEYMEGTDGPAASIFNVLNRSQPRFPILVTTCDHVLLTPEIVDTFLKLSLASDADLTVALATRETIEAAHPNVARTYLKFGDADYSSCNLFCLKTAKAADVVKFWRQAEKDRKKPWKIAWRFGLVSALRLLLGRPEREAVFKILSGRLGVNVRSVVVPFADAAVDVDTEKDLALVERILTERAG